MNLGLVTSYIIGGIILLSILTMNMSVSSSSTELTMTQLTREKASQVTELVSHDIQKMGYNFTGKPNSIIDIAKRKKIQFYSNIDDQGDIERIIWEFKTEETDKTLSTKNPNDYTLMRTVQDSATGNLIEETPIEVGVTEFNISYYENYGDLLSDSLQSPIAASKRENIKQLYIRIKLESAEKVYYNAGNEGRYIKSVWEKRFSPPNLESTNK